MKSLVCVLGLLLAVMVSAYAGPPAGYNSTITIESHDYVWDDGEGTWLSAAGSGWAGGSLYFNGNDTWGWIVNGEGTYGDGFLERGYFELEGDHFDWYPTPEGGGNPGYEGPDPGAVDFGSIGSYAGAGGGGTSVLSFATANETIMATATAALVLGLAAFALFLAIRFGKMVYRSIATG
jgi:hypothetical protein